MANKKDLEELSLLKKEVIYFKAKHEVASEAYNKEVEAIIKKQKLDIDNDADFEKILDIQEEMGEKYKTFELYIVYTQVANKFVMKGLKYFIKQIDDPRVKHVKELLELLQEKPSTLIIHRDRLLNLLMGWEGIPMPKKEDFQ